MTKDIRGLKGLSGLSFNQRLQWDNMYGNATQGWSEDKKNELYKAQRFVQTFGREMYDATSPEEREKMYGDYAVRNAFNKRYGPTVKMVSPKRNVFSSVNPVSMPTLGFTVTPNGGLGVNKGMQLGYDKTPTYQYDKMSPDDLQFFNTHDASLSEELLENNYTTPKEIEDRTREYREELSKKSKQRGPFLSNLSFSNIFSNLALNAINEYTGNKDLEKNQAIYDAVFRKGYEEDEKKALPIIEAERKDWMTSYSSAELNKKFNEVASKIPYYNQYWRNGKQSQVQEEMWEFLRSPSEKARIVGTYEGLLKAGWGESDIVKYMNYEAQDYIEDHQNGLVSTGLHMKQNLTGASSYIANQTIIPAMGAFNSGTDTVLNTIGGQDRVKVYVDNESGEIIPTKDVTSGKYKKPVSLQEMDRSTLFYSGKDEEGNNLPRMYNPQYWNDVTKYNTWDSSEIQKAKENGGLSIYNPVYAVGDTQSLGWDIEAMGSFVLADTGLAYLTAGMSKGATLLSKSAQGASLLNKTLRGAATLGKYTAKAIEATAPIRASVGIGNQYSIDVFDRSYENNLNVIAEYNAYTAKQNVDDYINKNHERYLKDLDAELDRLRKEHPDEDSNELAELAQKNVYSRYLDSEYQNVISSEENGQRVATARNYAKGAALTSMLSEAIKYSALNSTLWKWRFKPSVTQSNILESAGKNISKYVDANPTNVNQLIRKAWNSKAQMGTVALEQIGSGFATNYTDEMQSDFAIAAADSWFKNYMQKQANGTAYNEQYNTTGNVFLNAVASGLEAAEESMTKPSTVHAGIVGGGGSFLGTPIAGVINYAKVKANRNALDKAIEEKVAKGKISTEEAKLLRKRFIKNHVDYKYWDTQSKEALQRNRFTKLMVNLNNLVQNGLINEYAARRLSWEESGRLMNAAITFLDNNEKDFKSLKELLVDDIEVNGDLDAKDKQFVTAIKSLEIYRNMLKTLSETPEGRAQLQILRKTGMFKDMESVANEYAEQGELSEEVTKDLLDNFYAKNQHLERTDETDAEALDFIKDNLHEIYKASQSYDAHQERLTEYEKATGRTIDPKVKNVLSIYASFIDNMKKRKDTMNEELGTTSDVARDPSNPLYLLGFGDRPANIESHKKALNAQIEEYKEANVEANERLQTLLDEYEKEDFSYPVGASIEQKKLIDKRKKEKQHEIDAQRTLISNNEVTIEALQNRADELSGVLEKGENNGALLDVMSIFENLDISDNNSIDKAVETIKKLPYEDRARLIESIEKEIKRRATPDGKGIQLYNDSNFSKLFAIYNRMKVTDPKMIDKIKDVNKLANRIRGIEQYVTQMQVNPEMALSALDAAELAETAHAASLWNHQVVDSITSLERAILSKLKLKTLPKDPDRSKKYQQAYQTLFDIYSGIDNGFLKMMLKDKDAHPITYDIIKNASEYLETLDDIVNSAVAIADITDVEAIGNFRKKVINDIVDHLDSTMPSRTDLIHALHTLIDSKYTDVDMQQVYDKLVELDKQRGATVVETAEEAAKSRKKRNEWKKNAKVREANRQKELEAQAKRDKEKKESDIKQTKEEDVDLGIEEETPTEETPTEESEPTKVEDVELGLEEQYSDEDNNPITQGTIDERLSNEAKQLNKGVETPVVQAIPSNATQETENKETPTNSTGILLGHAVYRHDRNALQLQKKQVPRTPIPGKSLEAVNNWLEKEGINLTNIVDIEVGRIFAKNPNTKIQFLRVHPDKSKGDNVQETLFTVVEYNSDVQKIHNKDNGGVITAQDGKQYLIIGTFGYAQSNKGQQASYMRIKDSIKQRAQANRKEGERFYVDDKYNTTINTVLEGYIVRQLEGENAPQQRSIVELLNDPKRNPYGLKLTDLKWGIPNSKEVATVNQGTSIMYFPKDALANRGNLFVYIRAANGHYVPVKVNTTTLKDLKENSALKNEIDGLILELANTKDWEKRKEIASKIDKLLFFDAEKTERNHITTTTGSMFWVGGKNSNTISTEMDGIPQRIFDLNDPSLLPEQVLDAIYALNPRINISLASLTSETTLKKLAEAGALNVDIATLSTTGVTYTLNDMDVNGNPVISSHKGIGNGVIQNANVPSVLYNGTTYRFKNGEWVDVNDNVIEKTKENEHLLEQIKWNNIIKERDLHPINNDGHYDYFIINPDPTNPIVVAREHRSNECIVGTKEQALNEIENYNKRTLEKSREEALQKGFAQQKSAESVDLGLGEPISNSNVKPSEKENNASNKPSTSNTDTGGIESVRGKNIMETGKSDVSKGTLTFSSIMGSDRVIDVLEALEEKYSDLPSTTTDIEQYLKDKGINTTNITDIDSWLDNIKNCK